MRIERAYCVELEKIITADAARREFLSINTPPRRFNFLCADERCRAAGTRVSGVSYRVAAQEHEKYRTAHFRRWDDHTADCSEGAENMDEVDEGTNESVEEGLRRQARRKLTDFVDIFDPRPGHASPTGDHAVNRLQACGSSHGGESGRLEQRDISGTVGLTRTRYLEKLVDTFLEARSKLSDEEFVALRVHVINVGEISLRDYFCQIKGASFATCDRVLYGGAMLVKRYGAGFKLKFFDNVEGLPAFLYVSSKTLVGYRYKQYLNHILSHADAVNYFRVFAIGKLHQGPSKKSVDLTIMDLRHLAIILPPKRATPPDAAGNPSASSSAEIR